MCMHVLLLLSHMLQKNTNPFLKFNRAETSLFRTVFSTRLFLQPANYDDDDDDGDDEGENNSTKHSSKNSLLS